MWQIIVYTVAISAVLGLVGLGAEKLATMLGIQRRYIWALTMVFTVLWPLAAVMGNRSAGIAAPIPEQARPIELPGSAPRFVVTPSVEPTAVSGTQRNTGAAQRTKPSILRPPSDRTLLVAWGLMTGAMLLYLVGADLSMRRRASRWQPVTILGQAMHVSESTGPALLGALLPKIVVPRWFLDEHPSTQSLILEHELQHIHARDPLLLRVALLIVAAAPWNLPLWWQLCRMRQAIELDCDARVLGSGAEAASYGKVLLAVTQRAGNMPFAAVAMSEPVSALERRIRTLAAGPARYSAPRALAAIALWGAGIGVAASLEAPAIPMTRPAPEVPTPAPAAAVTPAPSGAQSRQPVQAGMTTGSDAQASAETAPSPSNLPPDPALPSGGPDLSIIPSNLLERMNVVTGGEAATYGSGAMAGVVNLVLNNRLVGFKLDANYGINEADITQRRKAAELELQNLRRRFNDNHPDIVAQKKLVEGLRTRESGPQPPQTSNPMEVRALINQMSEMSGGRYVIDPRVSGPVELGIINPHDPDSLTYHVFLEILGVHGFIAVRSEGAVTILPNQYARTVASPTIRLDLDENFYLGDDAEVVTAVIPLQSLTRGMANPQMLARSLAPLVSPWGYLSETHDNNGLLIVDKVANVKRIIELTRGKPE